MLAEFRESALRVTVILAVNCLRFSTAAVPQIIGSTSQNANIAENVAIGTSVVTIYVDIPCKFTIGGTDQVSFSKTDAGDKKSTTVLTNTALDYDSKTQYSIRITAEDNINPGTAHQQTVAITVTVNSMDPVFPSNMYAFSAEDGTQEGTVVGRVEAVKAEDPLIPVTISYSVANGNLDSVFLLESSTGRLTVAAGKTLQASKLQGYALTVTGVSSATIPETGTTTVFVTIGACPGSDAFGVKSGILTYFLLLISPAFSYIM